MNIPRLVILFFSHSIVAAVSFALGIYMLPILTAPESPSEQEITSVSAQATYQAKFVKELQDSDALHWGEGVVSLTETQAVLSGKLAPGPDYKLYFSPTFVDTEADFNRLKSTMVAVADIKTFDNFMVNFEQQVNLAEYNTVIVWCESFGQFITAAKYR